MSDLFAEYDALIKRSRQLADPQLKGSLYSAVDTNPDEEAGLHKLAQKVGMPVEALRNDRGAEARRQAAAQSVENLPSEAPTTAEFVVEPGHAQLISDDLSNLSALEKLIRAFRSGRQQQQQGRLAYKAMAGQVDTRDREEMQGLGLQVGGTQRMIDNTRDFGFLSAAQIAGQMWETTTQALPTATLAGMSAGGVAAVAGQAGPQAVLPEEIVTVPAAFGTAFGTTMTWGFLEDTRRVEAGHAYLELSAIRNASGQGIDPGTVALAAETVGLVNAAIEGLGLKIITAPYKAALKRNITQEAAKTAGNRLAQMTAGRAAGRFARGYGIQVGAETGTEIAQEVVNVVAEEMAKSTGDFEAVTPEEFGKRLWAIASKTAQGMVWLGLPGAGVSLRNDLQAARAARKNADFMAALGDTAKAAKLRERLPEKFQELIGRIKENGEIENVFIPAEQWRTFWQERQMDPAAVAQQVGADYAEALTTGGDLTIPLEAYVAQLAGSEHHADLLQDVRLHEGEMTPREAEAFRGEMTERFGALLEQAAPDEADSSRQVFEDVFGQLLGLGRERSTAEREALLWQARYRSRAERLGMDAFELYQEQPLTIRRPLPEVLTRRETIDTGIDPYLDALRAGAVPTEAEAFGQPLLGFLRERGISDDRGDLAAMDIDKGRKPFTRKLLREDGISLDTAGELAWEAGYFTERPTTAELLAAIDDELRGTPRYSQQAADEQAQTRRADLDQLRQYLEQSGVDLAEMNNEQVRRTLSPASGTMLFQTSARTEIKAVLAAADEPGNKHIKATIRPADAWLVDLAQKEGLDIDGYQHSLDTSAVRHIRKEHGDEATELARGQLPVTDEDLLQIPTVLAAPDKVVFGLTNRIGKDVVGYLKVLSDGTVLYLEEVRTGRKNLAALSLRKHPATMNVESILSTLDPNARGDGGNPTINIVEPPPAVKLFQIFAEGKRGAITFGSTSRTIEFFEKADLSTFLHESGHAWLEELKEDAARESAPDQVKEDWQTIAAWLGIDPDAAEISREAHEQFARGGEAYLMEGKAPSVELQAAFQRFKAWLLHIYRTVRGLNVQLNGEVRGVFDRLLATDEEIRQAEQLQQFTPIFTDAAAAGMTEREFAAYIKTVEAAHAEATDRLERQLMDELNREQQAWWKQQRAKVRAEVEAEAHKNPVYQAFQALTKGEDFDGNKAPEGFKLSKVDLVKMYGKEFVKKLPRAFQRIYVQKGGLHPDAVAEAFGFASGDELVQALANMAPMKQVIEAETDVRMREKHGDALNDGSIADEAMQAVHSDRQGEVLRAELRALKRKQREVAPHLKPLQEDERQARLEMESAIPPLEAFKLWAAQAVGHKALREVRPDLYLKAEQKAGRKAFEAAAKGDYATAGLEKQRQLLNHYLFIEATAARKEADKLLDYARQLQKPAAQARIGKAGGDYLEQINGLLEKYEFKPQSLETLAKRQTLLEWARQQEELGLEPAIPAEILIDAGKRNYKTLTIDELRAVRDALKNIEHLSQEVNHLRIEGEEIELNEALRDLSASAAEHFDLKRLPIDRETRSWLERQKEKLTRLDASLIKAEQLIEWLDGGRIDGPWARLIFRPIAAAESAAHDLTLQYAATLAELFRAYATETGGRLLEKIHIASLGESLTRQAVIAAALNTGNASNYAKLLKGYGWRPDQLEAILSHLDGADWQFVQSVWDAIETLWPQIEALEKRLSGVAPPKVQPRQITNRHGTFAGGYYPVVYDPLHSAAGEKQTDARGDKLFDATYVRATTEKGHTKARIEQAAYPMLLNLAVIPQHLAQVIHDLTHREAVVAANRLLNNAGLRSTLNATAGPAYYRMLRQWLANVANDRNIDRTGNEFWTRFFSGLRTNATIVGMGLRVTTMFSQLAGLSQSLDIVKGRYLTKALGRYARHPFQSAAWVMEKSGEMRHRSNSLDRDIRDGIRKLMGKKGPRVWLQGKAFAGIALFDALVSTPTWMAAYEQAKVEGHLSEKDAVAQADRAVRLSQGSGGAKDLAAVQRSNDLMKLFTMFYSYFSVLYNRLRNMSRLKGMGEITFLDVAFKSFVMVMLPAVAAELLSGRGPDDDEDPAEWAVRKIALYPLMSVPLLRDMANSWDSGYGYQLTPLSRGLETAVKLPGQLADTAAGEKDVDDLIFQAFDLPGYLFGLPTGQVKKTGRYIWDVWDGDIRPEDGGEIVKGILFGEKKGGK